VPSSRRADPRKLVLDALERSLEQLRSIDPLDSARKTANFRKKLIEAIKELSSEATQLDPVLRPNSMFDPSQPSTAGRIAALTMVAQERHRLDSIRPFYGSGVYAIYYRGSFEPYLSLSNSEQPLYVGKKDPNSNDARDYLDQGIALYQRLREHRRSISRATSTLTLADFDCRFLVVATGYQTAAEDYLINFFKPIWNNEYGICHGFGKHGDKAETRANARSPWDTLHPGRTWADNTAADQKPLEDIRNDIQIHLQANPPHTSTEAIIADFMKDFQQLTTGFRNATGEAAEIDADPDELKPSGDTLLP
jgi:hypothetical protein